jgi:predicted RNase H-like HicB family nuclease
MRGKTVRALRNSFDSGRISRPVNCSIPNRDNEPMKSTRTLTALIEREGDGFVSLGPELNIASQGAGVEEALANLKEALTLFFETAHPSEIGERLHGEVFVTTVEVAVG